MLFINFIINSFNKLLNYLILILFYLESNILMEKLFKYFDKYRIFFPFSLFITFHLNIIFLILKKILLVFISFLEFICFKSGIINVYIILPILKNKYPLYFYYINKFNIFIIDIINIHFSFLVDLETFIYLDKFKKIRSLFYNILMVNLDFLFYILLFIFETIVVPMECIFILYNKLKKRELHPIIMSAFFMFLFCCIAFYFLFLVTKNMILKLLLLPIFAIFHILILKSNYWIKIWNIFWAVSILLCSFILLKCYTIFKGLFWTPFFMGHLQFKFFGMHILYAFDMLSILFVILTCVIFFFVFLMLFAEETPSLKYYSLILFILYFMLLNIFIVQNLFIFFFFFESVVFPMYALILLGGSRVQKVKAANYFFFFTVIGSLFMFISINYLYNIFGTLTITKLMFRMDEIPMEIRHLIWLSFSFSFFVKIPVVPFHTWLPEAHVEAPTIGSVILAGILLKLGIYGIIRVNFYLLPHSNVYFSQYVYILCLVSIFYACIIAIRQTDIKRIIAYASIAHMNLMVLGLYSFTAVGIYGAIYQSISHGLISSALFFLIGCLYTRYKSRSILYYSGLTQAMPIFSFFFFIFTLANISFPLTSNFIGELLIFAGISDLNLGILILSLFGIVLNTIYSLWLCNRMLFGNPKSHLLYGYKDLTKLEIFVFSLLFLLVLMLGIFPNMIGNIHLSLYTHELGYVIKCLSYVHRKLAANTSDSMGGDSGSLWDIIIELIRSLF